MVAGRFDPLVVTAYPLVAIAPVPFSLLGVCLGGAEPVKRFFVLEAILWRKLT